MTTLTTDTVAFDLPPTATYAARSCEWVPPMPGVPGHLVLRTRRTLGGKETADVYAVREEEPTEPGTREFGLTKTTGRVAKYVCVVRPGVSTCTCEGGEARTEERHGVPCKHISALVALCADGAV